MPWFKRMIAAAVLSIAAVTATIGASYGADNVPPPKPIAVSHPQR
jgi:hypothetical protein